METLFKGLGYAAVIIVVAMLVCLVLGFPTMLLWNSTLPELFGFKTIDFWMAVRLNLLATMLIKSTSSSSKEK